MTDLWQWLADKVAEYRQREDYDRYSMSYGFKHGSDMIEQNPEQAVSIFARTRDRATELGEPWWAHLCDHWRCQTMLHYSGHIDEAGAIADACIDIVDTDDQFRAFPQRVCLHDDRASALQMIDPIGNRETIADDCDYIENEGRSLEGCIHCGLALRIDDFLLRGDLDTAQTLSLEALGRCRSQIASHYIPQYMAALCRIARRRQDWPALAHWAAGGEQYHGKMGSNMSNVELLMWNAVAKLQSGAPRVDTRRTYLRALTAARRTNHIQTVGYYEARADFLELSGYFAAALIAHQIQIDSRRGATFIECTARLSRIRLLKYLNRPVESEAAQLREASAELKDSAAVLSEMARLLA